MTEHNYNGHKFPFQLHIVTAYCIITNILSSSSNANMRNIVNVGGTHDIIPGGPA